MLVVRVLPIPHADNGVFEYMCYFFSPPSFNPNNSNSNQNRWTILGLFATSSPKKLLEVKLEVK
jgi:hypothetical protein